MKGLLYIIVIAISMFIGYSLQGSKGFTNNIHDTIQINHIDTFISSYQIIVDSLIIDTLVDTLYTIDSVPVPVLVPIVQKQYLDSVISKKDTAIIRSYVSGYKPKLDSTIIIFKSYDEIIIPKKDNGWKFGVFIGYGVTNQGLSPMIGVGITHSLFK